MLIKTKYIDCASKSVFNTWKLPTSAADTSGDIYWSAVVYIKDTGEVWTHGKLYGGFFSNADNNKVSLTIGGTTKILALDGHVQSYTTLTGSGSTADQAILSTGEANKWTLKTLGKNAFSNVDYLPADATAVAAEKVVHALAFQYNGKAIHSFDGSVARVLNIIQGNNVFITGDSQGNVTIAADPGSDTVNTAGATNLINKKLFLIGAESQTTSPQTYSNQYVYIGTDNCLYSLGKKVLTEHQAIYNLDLQTQVGDAVTKVTTFDPNAANNSFTLVQGTNVTLLPDATNKKVTISSKDTTYDFYNLAFKQGDAVIGTYKPTTSPSKTLKAGTNVTFAGSNNEVLITTQDTRNTAGATEKLATKLFLTGSLTQTDNPQTYTNSKVYIGTDNKLYSDGKVVSTGDHTHNYAGATSPGGPALKVDLNPSGLLAATYGSYGGILQDSNNGPATGSWSNRIKILHNNSSGYYTELAQAMTGTAGLWHRRNVAGVVSDWTPVIDKANFRTYLDATYVIRGNDPNVLTNYVRYSIASGLTMNWEAGNATPTHIWGAKNSDSSKAYVFNGDNIRAFANAVNRAGDTMTGALSVTTHLEVRAANTTTNAMLILHNPNRSWGNITFRDNMFYFVDGNSSTGTTYRPIKANYYIASATTLCTNLNADLLDGNHENTFLRYRGATGNDGEATLWSQIGAKNYHNAYPEGVTTKKYTYGAVISFASGDSRFDVYTNHRASDSTDTSNGIQYRSGWGNDKKPWRMLLDSVNARHYNVGSATKLQTARQINGTNFDGTANITTSYWGTARNFTIGNTTRSVNGSGNVSWSFADIGGAPASHSHNYIDSRGNLNPQTGRTQNLGNVYSYNTGSGTSNGAPTTHTSVIGFGRGTGGTVEIAGGWTAGMGLWYRALGYATDNWYGWVKVWDTKNFDPNSKANSNHNHDGSYITRGGSNNNVVLGAGGYKALSDFTLNSNWAASKDVSGYVKFPNGFIIQWGEAYVGANSRGYKSFPIAFPTACISVQVTHKTTATNWDKVCVAGNYNRTSCIIANGETVNSMINWMALGY